jgi:hypothetical protein
MDLANKIREIEALIASASSEGERRAAELAKQRLQEKTLSQPIEYSIRTDSHCEKRPLMALCQKQGLTPCRYPGQKRTTSMVRLAKAFLDQVAWPGYLKYSAASDKLAFEITNDLVQKIHRLRDEDQVEIAGAFPIAASTS